MEENEKKRVLLLANPCDVKDAVAGALMARRYDVRCCTTVDDAGASVTDSGGAHLAIVFLMRRGQDGSATIRDLRRTRGLESTPILVVGTEEMLDKQFEWREAGATAWVTGPVPVRRIVEMGEMLIF